MCGLSQGGPVWINYTTTFNISSLQQTNIGGKKLWLNNKQHKTSGEILRSKDTYVYMAHRSRLSRLCKNSATQNWFSVSSPYQVPL